MRAARAAENRKAREINVLDLRKIIYYADYFVLCTADSQVQMDAVTDAIEEALLEEELLHREGGSGNPWRLLDYGTVVVHVFHRETRQFYSLDRLYADAPRVRWQETERRATKVTHRGQAAAGVRAG